MPLQVNSVTYFGGPVKFDTAAENTSVSGKFVGVQGVVFYMLSSNDYSTYKIEVKVQDLWVEIAVGTCKTDTLSVVEISFYVPEARIKVTPHSTLVEFRASAYGYPAVFTRTLTEV